MENGSEKTQDEIPNSNRRNFLKIGLLTSGAVAVGSLGIQKLFSKDETGKGGVKTIVHTNDGKVYEANTAHMKECEVTPVSNEEARRGIPGKKFVMVIDEAKCDGCKKCTEACQSMHYIPSDREWIKVFKMQDSESTQPYFFPKPCFHCDNPPCTKVCPVNATFKRQDGIVLVDNERCIGCRSCMAACPYSTRFFNWTRPENPPAMAGITYSPEQGFPRKVGTVEKCDFCPHMAREGKLPACVSGCPMNAIYFGDQNEDAVTNSSGVTVRLSQLLEDNAGYRHLEELGTEPRVYYLPAKNRKYPKPEMNGKEEKHAEKKASTEMSGMNM